MIARTPPGSRWSSYAVLHSLMSVPTFAPQGRS
ncbi:hypothetical protein P3T27_002616 [Kitasatospora sp. MAA19]|nr:hypothetical protein [Kitasatospora sp. MAA19]